MSRTVTLPNGDRVNNVPDNVSDEEVYRKAIRAGKMSEDDLPANRDMMSGAYWRETAGNAPGSLLNQGADLLEAVTHPVRTFNNMADVAAGGVGNLFDIQESDNPGFLGIPRGARAKASALADFYKQRYGSPDQAIDTLREDPFSVIGDAATALTGVGGAIRGAGAASGLKALGEAGGAIGRAGAAIDPINILGNAAATPVRFAGASNWPTRLAQNALHATNPDVANLFLKKGYKLNAESYQKFQQDIVDLQQERAIAAYQNDIQRVSQIDAELKTYKAAYDVFQPSISRAQMQAGDLQSDIVIPAGSAAGMGYVLDQMFGTHGLYMAGPILGVAAGTINRPAQKLSLAQYLNNMKAPGDAFLNNDIYRTLAHQAIREVGNNETQYDLESALQNLQSQ